MSRLVCCFLPSLLLLCACAGKEVSNDIAALRVNVDSDAQAELQNVTSAALNGVAVTLADDALTQNSVLVLEGGTARRVDRPSGTGRNLSRPSRFRLVLDTRQCFLVHEETGLRWMLTDTECIAE